jgi:hypothetical protein
MSNPFYHVVEVSNVAEDYSETTAELMEAAINVEVAKGYDIVPGSFQVIPETSVKRGGLVVLMRKVIG